ncbi:alginate export family protein [Leptolyngbya ohadii]|uniref:alginate export family protein n=1 Tax=Leptolyngbya ohadii TaxID=1962290 RepID=UPI000B59FD4F|nr:alginate export family protein [Leptolyngbya ohadii]
MPASAGLAQEEFSDIHTTELNVSTHAADLEAIDAAPNPQPIELLAVTAIDQLPVEDIHQQPIDLLQENQSQENPLQKNSFNAETISLSPVVLPELEAVQTDSIDPILTASISADFTSQNAASHLLTQSSPEPSIDLSSDLSIDLSTSTQPPQSSETAYDPNAGIRIPLNLGEGRPIERVYIYLTNPTDDAAENETLQQEITEAFGIEAGESFSPLFVDRAIRQVQGLPFVESVEYRLYESNAPGRVIVAVLATLKPTTPQPEEASPAATTQQSGGILGSGDFGDFPTLYVSDRALFKFVLNGSVGLFSDTNPWFGNPQNFVFSPYQPNGTITWGEYSLEAGLAGITRIGDAPFYLYGAATYMISSTVQPDIFQEDDRFDGAIEQLYAGFLIAERGNPIAFNFSVGRQKFQLNQGFLFSQFSGAVNAQDRGASYLNPRTAYDMTVLANARIGNFRLQGFFLEPNLLSVQPRSQYLGANLSYNDRTLEASLAYITIPYSEAVYLLPGGQTEPREGLQVINPRIRFANLFGVDGLWAESEYAYEFSDRFNMSAHGAYIWVGYTANHVSWQPSFSYRFSGFSGDDPNTAAYERFDPLQAGGLSDWLQGLTLGKVFNNSNNFSHRVSVSVQPNELLSLSLVYYYRYANQLNNLGGSPSLQNLQSRDIGHELQLLTRYSLSRNLLLQFLSSIAFPGTAIQRAVSGETDPWFTIQLSAYMFF